MSQTIEMSTQTAWPDLSPVGLRLQPGLDYDQWAAIGVELTKFQNGVSWAIADWLFYGEGEVYGRSRYDEAVDRTGLGYQALADLKYVAGRFAVSRRRENLSISHHREVAAMNPADQDRWLDQAADEGWSQKKLREQITAARTPTLREQTAAAADRPLPPAPESGYPPGGQVLPDVDELVVELRLDRDRSQQWLNAAAAAGDTLTEWIIGCCDENS